MMRGVPTFLALLSILSAYVGSALGTYRVLAQSRTVVEQQGSDKPVISAKPAAASAPAGSLPQLSDADKVALRDLQVEQDRWIIELGDLEAAYLRKKVELKAKIDDYHQKVQQLAYDLAVKQKLDPKEFVLNLRTMTWEKKEPKKESPKEKKE